MDAKQKRLRPKLERRNAIKNSDYDASTSPSSSFDESARRSRSLEVYRKQTSFRIKGIGDFDLICRNLGLSGPDDFAIPTAAWEAQKAISSSRLRNRTTSAEPDSDVVDDLSDQFQARITLSRLAKQDDPSNLAGFESRVKVSSVEAVGPSSTIKGVRPPILAPPPVMLRPMVDNVSSTWDLLKSFAPQDDSVLNSHINNISSPSDSSSSSDGEKNRVVEENEVLVGETEREVRLGETDHPLESSSSSFRSNHNDYDDVFHTSREITVYSFSPSGSFMRSITSWQKGELLGSGSFGTVFEGFTEDGYFFAVKEVSLLDQGSQGKQSVFQLEQEISLLSQFQHENIVQYLGTSKDESKLYIFLELVTKGSLASLYNKYRLRDSQVSAYTRQILNGLMYLHDQNVVHRDIKCANILVDANGSVKLADFGLAKATKLNDVKSCKGTAFWMAPEVVNLKNRGYGLAADIWSLGCTVLEMLTRRPPYSHLEGMQALFMIGKGNPPPVPDYLSSDARDFILKCIQVNPNDRPSATQLLNHPFVRRPLQNSFGPASPHCNGTRS